MGFSENKQKNQTAGGLMKNLTRTATISLIILLSLVVSACGKSNTDTIKIGAQTFTEAKKFG
jgi:glycine betaine/choline ABC-type transport system substrate-binding protein